MKTSVIKLKVILNDGTEIEGIGFHNLFEYQSYFFGEFNRKDVKEFHQVSYFSEFDIDFSIKKVINIIDEHIKQGFDNKEIYKSFGL